MDFKGDNLITKKTMKGEWAEIFYLLGLLKEKYFKEDFEINDVVRFVDSHKWSGCLGIIEGIKDCGDDIRYFINVLTKDEGEAYIFSMKSMKEFEYVGYYNDSTEAEEEDTDNLKLWAYSKPNQMEDHEYTDDVAITYAKNFNEARNKFLKLYCGVFAEDIKEINFDEYEYGVAILTDY